MVKSAEYGLGLKPFASTGNLSGWRFHISEKIWSGALTPNQKKKTNKQTNMLKVS